MAMAGHLACFSSFLSHVSRMHRMRGACNCNVIEWKTCFYPPLFQALVRGLDGGDIRNPSGLEEMFWHIFREL